MLRGFGGWPTVETSVEPIDHVRWKIRSEIEPPPVFGVAECNGRIVARVHLMFGDSDSV